MFFIWDVNCSNEYVLMLLSTEFHQPDRNDFVFIFYLLSMVMTILKRENDETGTNFHYFRKETNPTHSVKILTLEAENRYSLSYSFSLSVSLFLFSLWERQRASEFSKYMRCQVHMTHALLSRIDTCFFSPIKFLLLVFVFTIFSRHQCLFGLTTENPNLYWMEGMTILIFTALS